MQSFKLPQYPKVVLKKSMNSPIPGASFIPHPGRPRPLAVDESGCGMSQASGPVLVQDGGLGFRPRSIALCGARRKRSRALPVGLHHPGRPAITIHHLNVRMTVVFFGSDESRGYHPFDDLKELRLFEEGEGDVLPVPIRSIGIPPTTHWVTNPAWLKISIPAGISLKVLFQSRVGDSPRRSSAWRR